MRVLLSIKPEFADKIFDGTKKFEFRRTIFKNPNVKNIVVYASSPIQKVVGEFEVEEIITHNPSKLWEITKKYSGISEHYFFEYFADKEAGFAIRIKRPIRYKTPKCIKADYNVSPPQSFLYLAI